MLSTNQAMPDRPQLHLERYNGPLDLLLTLIEQQRLDITEISLAQVADQYMAAVRTLEAPDPDAIAEFLVIGAKLLVIKTRALLPRPPAELASPEADEDVGEQLARQLIEYQRFKQAAQQLRTWEQQGRRSYARHAAPPIPPQPKPTQLDVSLHDLVTAMQRRMQLLLPLDEQIPMPVPKVITIADVRAHLNVVLRQQRRISFEDLLSLAFTRNEVIVTLWTVLELFKRGTVTVEQDDLFSPIMIARGPTFDTQTPLDDENRLPNDSEAGLLSENDD